MLKLALYGYGSWGKRAIRAAAREFDLVSIVESNEQAAEQARKDWSAWGVEVLPYLNQNVDVAWICTPGATHLDIAEECFTQHNLHVLCEKPATMAVYETEYMVECSQKADKALMIGHLPLYSGILHSTRIGSPGHIVCRRYNDHGPSLSDQDVLWGLGPHDVALLYTAYGLPKEIYATGNRHRTDAHLVWENATAYLEWDWLAEKRLRELTHDGMPIPTNKTEPLLSEAQAFNALIETPEDWETKRIEAINVTYILATIEDKRNQW